MPRVEALDTWYNSRAAFIPSNLPENFVYKKSCIIAEAAMGTGQDGQSPPPSPLQAVNGLYQVDQDCHTVPLYNPEVAHTTGQELDPKCQQLFYI